MKHAQGEPVKGDFDLTRDNIDEYMDYSIQMDKQIRRLNVLNDLKYKLDHVDELDDELYTKEYLVRRLEKVQAEMASDGKLATEEEASLDEIRRLKSELADINKEIDKVRPLVFDKVEGTKAENHERMSDLDDERKRLEEAINDYYGKKFPKLKANLPKIYYMILDGVDMDTVVSCFRKMKMVLMDQLGTEEAASELMDESTSKYNLPAGLYDPIRQGAKKLKSKGSKGSKGKKGKK